MLLLMTMMLFRAVIALAFVAIVMSSRSFLLDTDLTVLDVVPVAVVAVVRRCLSLLWIHAESSFVSTSLVRVSVGLCYLSSLAEIDDDVYIFKYIVY